MKLNEISAKFVGFDQDMFLSEDEKTSIRNLAKVSKDTLNALNTIANLETKDIFRARDLANAALKRYKTNGLI